MSEPVLVVHGIANHDADQFKATVASLQRSVSDRFRLIEVFWGDLGGESEGLADSLPVLFPQADTTRGDGEGAAFLELLQAQRVELMGQMLTRAEDTSVVEALYAATIDAAGLSLPAPEVTRGDNDALKEALVEALPGTQHLRTIRDVEVQQAVGRLLADHLRTLQSPGLGGGDDVIVTRSWLDDIKQSIKRFLHDIDQLIGRMAASVAGSANQWVRGALAHPIALTLGDIVAYHQRRTAIHTRLFDVLDREAPGYGTEKRPIAVLAHSLGGLITFDAALGSYVPQDGAPRQLHISRWVTFGSQPAFFHVLAPRSGIAPYRPGRPVTLPGTIGKWTNLWHPLDILAFTAGTVFRLSTGQVPKDLRVDTAASEIIDRIGWLHSAYWSSTSLVDALKP
jgi:hypothetical protein